MVEKLSSDPEEQDGADDGGDPEVPIRPPVSHISEKADAEGQSDDRRSRTEKTKYQRWDALKRNLKQSAQWLNEHGNAVTAIATVIIAVTGIIYTHYAGSQWRAMNSQLNEMQKQYPEMQKSAKAAQGAADIASDTFNLTFRPRVEILGMGAWREVVNGKMNNHLEGGQLTVQVTYINRGPFSARNVRVFTYDRIGPAAIKGSYGEETPTFRQIPPMGAQPEAFTLRSKTRYSSDELQGLIRGTLHATFSVLIVYDDDLGKSTHHAEYCDVYTLKGFNDICPWPIQND